MADNSLRDGRPLDLTGQTDPTSLTTKIIYAGTEAIGQPYLVVTEDGLALVGDKKKVVTVGSDFGLSLQGVMSLSAMPEQISFGGGYWRINPLVLSTVPSTTPTPVPWIVKSTPRLLAASGDITGAVSGLESLSDIPLGL